MNRRIIPALITALALVCMLMGCRLESVERDSIQRSQDISATDLDDHLAGQLPSVAIPIVGEKYYIDGVYPGDQGQSAAAHAVVIREESILTIRELSDGTGICWYIDGDEVCCAYRKNGGDWWWFLSEGTPPPSYRDTYDAELFSDLFGHSGFIVMALRGAAYFAQDYYYVGEDGELKLLFAGTLLDVIADFNGDGENELMWFYHGGRDAIYFYADGDEIFRFDVIEALLARFDDWSHAVTDPLSIQDGIMEFVYQIGEESFDGYIRFTQDEMIVVTGRA